MNQQPNASSTVRLAVRTGLRAGADIAPNELIEATRHFLQSLLNALPATPSAPSAAPSTAPAASQPQ